MSGFDKSIQHVGAGLLAASAAWAQSATPINTPVQPNSPVQPNAVELVDALKGVFGKQAGARASHAKGLCVSGHFFPDAQASQVTHGPLWSQRQVPVQGRFSVGGGNPKASDKAKTVRGLALAIGPDFDLVTLSAPVFMVSTPEEFVAFMAARQPDPATGKPDVARVKAFNDKTPSTQAQIAYLSQAPVVASYAQSPYWGVNAFRFTNAQGKTVHGRWRLEPRAGHIGLTDAQLAELDDHFLAPELKQRLAQGPAVFNVWLQLAGEKDDVKNPAQAWPAGNPEVRMGQIVLTTLDNSCESRMFNPAHLPKGIALSDDPTLQVRAGSYGVSLVRRLTP